MMRRWRILVTVVLVGAVCAAGLYLLLQPGRLPIRSVLIEGELRRTQRAELEAAVASHVAGGFFRVDVHQVRGSALALPWVAEVSVRRLWPDTLHLTVTERRAVARSSGRGLLDEQGELFSPALQSYPRGLPTLMGPPGTERLLLTRLRELDRLLAPLGRRVVLLELSERNAWRAKLDTGAVFLFGRRLDTEQLRRLVGSLGAIMASQGAPLSHVDLRYPNGFAVRAGPRSAEAPRETDGEEGR